MNKLQSQEITQTASLPTQTHSVLLSALIKNYIGALPDQDWRVLAIDPLNDMVVLVREVKTQ